jgi:hypothetical protein
MQLQQISARNSYLRTECRKTFFAHERIIPNLLNTSSHIEVCTIFFETNIVSDLSCILYAFAKMSIELIVIHFHSFEIFNIQIGEMVFCKPEFIITKSNYFQNAPKGECFLDNFEAVVRETYVCG